MLSIVIGYPRNSASRVSFFGLSGGGVTTGSSPSAGIAIGVGTIGNEETNVDVDRAVGVDIIVGAANADFSASMV